MLFAPQTLDLVHCLIKALTLLRIVLGMVLVTRSVFRLQSLNLLYQLCLLLRLLYLNEAYLIVLCFPFCKNLNGPLYRLVVSPQLSKRLSKLLLAPFLAPLFRSIKRAL